MGHYRNQMPGHPSKVNIPMAASHVQKSEVAGSQAPKMKHGNAGEQASTKRGNKMATSQVRANPAYKQGSVRGSTL